MALGKLVRNVDNPNQFEIYGVTGLARSETAHHSFGYYMTAAAIIAAIFLTNKPTLTMPSFGDNLNPTTIKPKQQPQQPSSVELEKLLPF